jgi:hypothetical protein
MNVPMVSGSVVPPGHKRCKACEEVKPLEDFHRNKRQADGRAVRCRECVNAAQRDRYAGKGRAPGYVVHWGVEGRRCTGCRVFKPWASFYRQRRGHKGRMARCKSCVKMSTGSSRQVNLEQVRRTERERKGRTGANYKARYGIDRDRYEAMARAQAGACAICGEEEKRLVVDHDHATGAVRELLCDRCNRLIGVLEEPGLVDLGMAYIERHRR